MDTFKLLGASFPRSLFAVVLLIGIGGTAAAQVQGKAAQQPKQDPSQDQNQNQPDQRVRPAETPTTQPPTTPSTEKPEVKITPREAEELFHSVDEILAFDSKQTGLSIKKQVKRRLTSRDEVEGYLTKHMKDEDVKRLQRSELVLKKFGLLPRDF